MRFRCFAGIQRSGSKPRTSPAMRHFWLETSKSVIGPMPERPAHALAQIASTPMPIGVTPPRPVITTRRPIVARTLASGPGHGKRLRTARAAC